ncbi:hypothetical protein Tco_0872936 [Tanacetum coccineum]
MTALESCSKHNMVAFLEKTDGNAEFHEIIDFLTRSSIHYALTVSPVVSTTFVEQFWTSAKSDLLFNDVDGIESMTNQAIFDAIQQMGYEVQPTEEVGAASERHSEPTPTPSPHQSTDLHETEIISSPRPSPIYPFLIHLQKLLVGIKEVTKQAKEIQTLKAKINKLKKKTKPFIVHHTAWVKAVNLKRQQKKKALQKKRMHRDYVSKQGRKEVKSFKGEPSVPKYSAWDDLDVDIDDTMEYTLAQDEGTDNVIESPAQQLSTDKKEEGADKPKISTDSTKVSIDGIKEGIDEPELVTSATPTAQTSIPPAPTTLTTPEPTFATFADDDTIAQVLLNMSQAKVVEKEKEKGVEFKDVEESERPRTISTRSDLTLKPLLKIDPKDKGKKRIEEDKESDTESEGEDVAVKKVKQLVNDEELARKVEEDWAAEEERKRLADEETVKIAQTNEYDFIQARMEADRLLALRLQEQRREQFTVEERAKFLHDTIAAQRKFLAQQRSEATRNKSPTKNQLRNQIMTYLKHVGNKKHADLKTKGFDEIKAMYEKLKRFDKNVDTTTKVPAKQEEKEQGTKKRKGSRIKTIARKKAKTQSKDDSDEELRLWLTITPDEDKEIDYEVLDSKYLIIE